MDLEKTTARRWGKPLDLTALEFHLLLYLAQNQDRAIRIDELLVNVWSAKLGMGGTTDQVKSCVKRLRRKIEPDPIHPRYLYSLRGRGYLLRDPFMADSND